MELDNSIGELSEESDFSTVDNKADNNSLNNNIHETQKRKSYTIKKNYFL